MKFLFDFFPVIVFYVAYTIGKRVTDEVQSMVIATALLIAATCIQVGVTWVRKHKVEKMHIIVLALAIIFGGATIYFRDPAFLIWKVTLAYWLFAMAFLASHYIGEAPIIKRMMQHAIELPEMIWRRVSYMWILFFAAVGIINLIIARNVSFDAWVNFKLFGTFGLTLIFVIIQSIYLARHAKEKPAEEA